MNSKREDVILGIKKFESVIKKYPSFDASPIYTKSKNSFFDIDSIELLKMSNRGKSKPNKTRAPSQMKSKNS